MRFVYVDGVFVGAHTAQAPRDDEWERHCKNLERERTRVLGVLVYTDGGGPTTHQRKLLRSALHDSPAPPTAIITNSLVVRGIITSLNWFANNQLAAFEPQDLDGALRHLQKNGAAIDKGKLVGSLRALASELSITLPTTWVAGRADEDS